LEYCTETLFPVEDFGIDVGYSSSTHRPLSFRPSLILLLDLLEFAYLAQCRCDAGAPRHLAEYGNFGKVSTGSATAITHFQRSREGIGRVLALTMIKIFQNTLSRMLGETEMPR
jgi:hypothetical protein